ncbi:hypothetical protein BASA61_001470 [Batrachochytrium salamandrivorans]|nr:hypothetical protein BASA61_001470 [Batrachochytrium salamandrivorans]
MKVSFVSILATAAIVISTVQCTSYNLWSVERQSGRVKCLPYTQEQRGSIMGNVDRMMKIWVNSDSKQNHYNGKANPYPDLDKFRKTYGGMTDDQFNLGLTTIFNKMRDRHTLYYKAGPYGCFSVTTGVFFKLIDDSLGSSEPPKVRVVGMTDTPEVLDLIGNVLSTVAVGDELLTVNGVPFYDWYEQNKFILGFGANDSGGQRGAFQYLEGVLGSSNILPEVDDITLQLRRLGRNQELYTVTVPYVSSSNDECWSLSSSLYKELNGTALPKMPAPKSYRQKRSVLANGASLPGNSISQRGDATLYKRSYWDSIHFEDTSIDGWRWAIWKTGERNMGVIKIESFSPVLKDTKEDTNFMFSILTIRDLLVNQLKDTDSILFDVRGNPGGFIAVADGIIQLFKPDVAAAKFNYLKNEVTKDLFYKGPTSKIHGPRRGGRHQIAVVTLVSDRYTIPPFRIPLDRRTVFGDDETTGGGGANVFASDDIYFTNRPLEYIADPFTRKLTGKNLNDRFYTRVTVGARQLVRSGKHAGQLIEDDGVKADVIVRSTIDDILPGDTGISAYNRIADYLYDVAKRQMDSKVYFMSEPYDRVTFEDLIDVPVVVSGVDEIIVVYQGEELGSWKGESSTLHQDCVIQVKTPKGLHSHLVTFIGKKQGRQVFKTYRQIIRISTSNDRINMMTANSHTVSGPSSSVGVYSFGSMSEQEGWNFNNDKWTIGDGVSDYSEYMHSTIRVWLSAPVGARINVSLDATVDTDEDGGYFSLDTMDDFGEVVPMLSSKSENGLTQYKSITGRSRVIKGTYSFTVTTENFSLGLDFVSYGTESPFSVNINSIVLTKN